MTELKRILIERDEISSEEADSIISYMRELIYEGEDPEEVLLREVGLELDYIFDVI